MLKDALILVQDCVVSSENPVRLRFWVINLSYDRDVFFRSVSFVNTL